MDLFNLFLIYGMPQVQVKRSQIGVSGFIELDIRHQIKSINDLVVTAGKEFLCKACGSYSTATGTPSMRYIAVGSSQVAPAAGQTALGGELARGIGSYVHPSGSTYYRVYKTFPAGTATGNVYESGCFNKSTGGAMLNRGTFGLISKGASDTLKVTWTISFS
jgi:hypothetical protein